MNKEILKYDIQDDFDLLENIVSSSLSNKIKFPLDGPTKDYFNKLYLEIKSLGLKKMIEMESRQLNNLSGIIYSPIQQMQYNFKKLHLDNQLSTKEKDILCEAAEIIYANPDKPLLPYEMTATDLDSTSYLISEIMGQNYGLPSAKNSAISPNLNTGYKFTVENNQYNYS